MLTGIVCWIVIVFLCSPNAELIISHPDFHTEWTMETVAIGIAIVLDVESMDALVGFAEWILITASFFR